MKDKLPTHFKRLEQKINLLNDKLDRIMEVQGITLRKGEELIQKEAGKKQRARERQEQKRLEKEQFQQLIAQRMEDRSLVMWEGTKLMHTFNLAQQPSAARIKEYQRTKDPRTFDGLKRVPQGGRK